MFRRFLAPIIIAHVLACSVSTASGESLSSGEYLIKAAFLYNFAKFVEWPPETFRDDHAPLNLYVLGTDPFGESLNTIKEKTVKGRSLSIKRINRVQEAKGCHILFISPSEKKELGNILDTLKGSHILTVSEIQGFAQMGGIINFIIIEKKVHFEINPDAAQSSMLKISSQILKLAKIVTSVSRMEKK